MGPESFLYYLIQTSACVLFSIGVYDKSNQILPTTAELLRGYGPPFLESRFHALWFSSHRSLKKHIAGKRFLTDTDVKRAAIPCVLTVDIYFFYAGIPNLVQLWDKYLYVSDDYVGVWCVPSATHVLCIGQGQNKILDVKVFLPYFFWNYFVLYLLWRVDTPVMQKFWNTVISPKAGALFVTNIAGSKRKILRRTGSKQIRGRLDVFSGSKKSKSHKIMCG